MFADLVLKSSAVFTALGDRSQPGAVAIAGDRIADVGPVDEVLGRCGEGAEVIDLGDSFVCPGFIDSHLHFHTAAMNRSRLSVFCEGSCAEDCVDALAAVEDARPRDEFMLSYGWYHPLWRDPSLPTRDILDRAYPDRPVCLMGADVHTLWLNSAGLAKLGIDEGSVPPPGGIYRKDASGRLTGIVQETAAFDLFPRIYRFSREEEDEAVSAFIGDLHANGITGVGDLALFALPGADMICDDVLARFDRDGRLDLRVSLFPTALDDLSRARGIEARFAGSRFVRLGGLKQFFDGVTSTHTAWLHEPYANADGPDDVGRPTVAPERMRRLVLGAAAAGYAVRVHTIGDRAVETALDIFAEAIDTYGQPRVGAYGLEHLERIDDGDIPRLAQLGVLANVQPPHATLDPEGTVRDLGRERALRMWPFASYERAGVSYSFGTDAPVVDIDSRAVLYDAVTRRDAVSGLPEGGWAPDERLSAAQAVRAYTRASAAACGRAEETGTLEPGKLADIAVLDRDIVGSPESPVDPELIRAAEVVMTLVGGKVVYTR